MQVKLEDIQKKNSGFDNYSQGLGQILRGNEERQQPGLKQGEDFNDLQEGTRQATIMPPNSISTTNGIWDEAALRQISGWREAFKSETLISTMETLREFHSEMRKEISAEWMGLGDSANEVRESYEELLKKVSHYVQRGSKWNAFVHLHRKEEKAMLPAMSVLLIKLYSLGNVFENIKNLTFDYMVENGKTVAKISDIITSSMAGSLQGNMAFTGMQTNQTDKTSYQMRKETSGEEYSAKDEIKTMQLPALNDKNKMEDLRRLAMMIEAAELRATSELGREQFIIEYGDLLKMIYILLNEEKENEEEKISWKEKDITQASMFWKEVAGMKVEDAVSKINKIRMENFETASQKSIKSGGDLSGVLIDTEKKRVLRSAENQKTLEEKRDNNNYNYDEAMSRLAEVTGLKSQAGARTAYYKDLNGKLQYGTNMDLAGGQDASRAKLSFGDKETDDRMRGGRHNIFGSGSEKELNRNADMIVSSYKMQILDYIACHQDRNIRNYFIDLNAKDPMQAFVGIDNDNVFGKGLGQNKGQRKVENLAHVTNSYAESTKSKYKDVMTVLDGFEFIPEETRKDVENLNPEKINETLKPYLDRSARFAVINRITKLKEYVKSNARVIDIRTKEGMEAFKKETLNKMLSVVLETSKGDNVMGSAGPMGSSERSMPGILMRALMAQYFTMANVLITKKDGSYDYMSEFEYIPEGKEAEYLTKANVENRFQNFWKTFDAMLRVVGKTRAEIWDEAMEKKYGKDDMEQKASEEEYKKIREAFISGKMKFFNTFNVK